MTPGQIKDVLLNSSKLEMVFYFLALPTNHNTKATIATTTITPTHIPALKIPSIAEQLENTTIISGNNAARSKVLLLFFMFVFFSEVKKVPGTKLFVFSEFELKKENREVQQY